MILRETILPVALQAAAIIQLAVAILNLGLVRLLGWRDEIGRLSPLARQVFHVHLWFVSITLTIFAVLTWRLSSGMIAGEEAALWLAGAIGIFWAVRTIMQVVYYSSTHWWGRLGPTIVHVALLVTYGGMSTAYLWTAAAGVIGK